jgi:hypothetical protein
MRLFGEPCQSSISSVRRFEKGDLRVFVEYERELDAVLIQGLAAIGRVILTPNAGFGIYLRH